jgi:hypothetical protein
VIYPKWHFEASLFPSLPDFIGYPFPMDDALLFSLFQNQEQAQQPLTLKWVQKFSGFRFVVYRTEPNRGLIDPAGLNSSVNS